MTTTLMELSQHNDSGETYAQRAEYYKSLAGLALAGELLHAWDEAHAEHDTRHWERYFATQVVIE